MSFTHMGAVAGMASPDSSSSQMYRRGVLIHCPPEYSVDIVPPVKEGSSWHYGLRVKPLPGLGSPIDSPGDAKARRIKGYEIHRKWEDCLDLQRLLEKEYAAVAKARKGGKKIYGGRPERAASFDSLPTGPDPKTIPTDIHAFIPRLAAKSSLFRGASGSALVQQRSEEFNEFISALFAPGVPILVDEVRQTPSVREWFGFWRRDRDSMRRRDGDRASIAPSTRRLSIASDAPPLPPNSTSPFTSSPLAQTSYESSPISSQEEPRQSCDTTYGDLASALDTFPMPPTPLDGPVALEPSPKASTQPMPSTGFVPIVQRRLGLVRNDAARNAAFRNAQFFSHPPTSPLPPLPKSVPASDCEYESDRARRPDGRPRRATSPSMSSSSTHLTQPTRSASPRSSRTSDWSMSAMAQALGLSIDEPEPAPAPAPTPADEQSEIEYARKASLSSLSSTSSKRPPPIPPRSSLRRSQSSGAHIQKQERPIPTVVYDEHEPEFEITHSVLNSYFEDNRASMLSSAVSSNSGSSVRRSMTPSIASAYSTTSSVGSTGVPSTPLTAIPAHEIVLKAACPVGDSIVIARIPRALPLEAVRSVLATKFRQAAGVQLDLLEHGFVLGYLSAPVRPTRPGTGGRPVTPARSSARPPAGRTRSSSLSSMAACADPTHLTLIVTQRDWENAVAKHGDKMTVRVLLAGSD